MTVIASEISYVHPFIIDSLQSLPGERFDFVINADKPAKDYWVRVKTIDPCREPVEAFAILRYGDEFHLSADTKIAYTRNLPPRVSKDVFSEQKIFNVPEDKDRSLLQMKAHRSDHSIISSPPDQKFYLFIDSPTVLDSTLNSEGNYYRLSCKLT